MEDADVAVPEGVEAVWLLLTSKSKENQIVNEILVGGIYILPRSLHKQQIIEHIIKTIFTVQSKYEHQVRFIISGDFNKVSIEDV